MNKTIWLLAWSDGYSESNICAAYETEEDALATNSVDVSLTPRGLCATATGEMLGRYDLPYEDDPDGMYSLIEIPLTRRGRV